MSLAGAAALALAALGALPAPAAGAPTPAPAAGEAVKAGVRRAWAELAAWDAPAARRIADELVGRGGDDLSVQELLAHVAFEEGDYAGAVAILDNLQKAGYPVDDDFLALARNTRKVTEDHLARESEHFVIRFAPGRDAVLVPYALEALEKQRAALASQLGWVPPGKVRVEVLESEKDLARVSTLSLEAIQTSGTIALCKFDRLMLVSPKALVLGYEWQDTLAHEYTHFVVSKLSRNTVPIWLHEGLAKFFESSWRGAPGLGISPPALWLLHDALKKNKLIPFEKMHPSMALLPSQADAMLAFAEVFTAVEYLYGKGGSPLLLRIIDHLKAGHRYETAVSRALGVPFSRFQRDWAGYLARRDFPRETLSVSARLLRFKDEPGETGRGKAKPQKGAGPGDEPEQDEARFGELMEIEDLEARRLAHLGELLRLRGRPAAAVEELSKAYARVGNRSPALSSRYAQALMKLNELSRAEQILRGSLKSFPGDARTQRLLGEIYLATKRWNDAEHALLEVIGVNPFDPRPHVGLALIYKERGDRLRLEREQNALAILRGSAHDAASLTTGSVEIRCHPWARVWVDGVDTGKTTPARLDLAAGAHALRLVNEERGFTRELSVQIGAGEEKTVEVDLDAPPPESR